jgi:hypothetical protein
MPAAQLLAAVLAMAAVDRKLADNGATGNLALELLIETIFDDRTPTVGTLFGQGSIELFINVLGRRWLAMGVRAVLFASFAARLLGTLLGFTFGEGRRLAFARAFGFVKALAEIANGLLQLLDKPIAFGELLAKALIFQLESGHGVHAHLDSDKPLSAVRDYRDFQ